MTAESPQETSRTRAESAYAMALSSAAPGAGVDIDGLAKSHPELAEDLRAVHGDWERARGIHEALSWERSVADQLNDRYGANVDPGITLQPREDADGPKSLSRAVIDRLSAHGPKQSRYEVIDEVARGGMGAVLKVWDPDLRRTLAMKVALTPKNKPKATQSHEELAKTELPLARFLEEAQVTGQLDHPGVVPVHELGVDSDGQVYFTMRLVRGETFAAIIDRVHANEEGWTLARAVRLLLKICETVAYAHDKNVIHRDLKPANVMVGRFGELYVMDWGLARVMGREGQTPIKPKRRDSTTMTFVRTDRRDVRGSEEHSHIATMTGDVVGTPAYMSPLQAQGEVELLDRRADVYSIGAILYHLLAGHMPYVLPGKKMDAYAIWGNLLEKPPHPLEERAPDAPPELVAICEKAMARKLQARYPNVDSLAEDLHSFLDGRVVRAYERGAVAEFRKWFKRNRATATASAAAIFLAIGGLGAVSYVQASAKNSLAEKNEALAEANEAERAARDEALANEAEARREKTRADEKSAEAIVAQRVAEERAEEVARQRDAADRAIAYLVDLFRSPDPARTRGALVTAKDLLDRGAYSIESRLDQDPLVRARLMATMGLAYHELGLFEEAEPLLIQSFEERSERLGADDPETIEARNILALLYRSQGRFDEARELYDESLRIALELFGPDHVLTLDTKNALARLNRRQDRFEEARRLHEEVLEGRQRLLGANAAATLETHLDLAQVYRDLNRLDDARDQLRLALDGYRSEFGDDYPEALRTLNELGMVEQRSGRLNEAQANFEDALEGRRRVLGDDHPETLWSQSDLAHIYLLQERFFDAEELFRDALERHQRILGPDHPDSLTILAGLGGLYQLQDRLDDAERTLREVVERALAALGPDDHRTLGSQVGLAAVYTLQGRADEAEPLYRDALEGFRRVFGEDNPQTLVIQHDLVQLLYNEGRHDEAVELAAQLLDLTPPDDPAFAARELLFRDAEAAAAGG